MKYTFIYLLTVFFSCKDQPSTSVKNDKIAAAEEIQHEIETTYYFIRHGEKDRSTDGNNPSLKKVGQERAENWAKILQDKKIDLVYSSNFKRTQQTAAPTAKVFNTEVRSYSVKKLNDVDFQKETKGKTVLVVGHSDTTPKFVNLILGKQKYKDIDDGNNSNLYKIVVYKNGKMKSSLTKHPL
ncbi:SixA phosphatase family protein [Mesonia ostreae]|uniref:Histidine phosphatase family protein n=1 Tax=Mesonia ostreae TaxID=861110 RepID=A0ABU2KLQ8_9FLAO|nr:histidine phosphatase family protein [Mesonia ostreae]MDT0295598.1 histidine phosphatase family protein [Mesonia ostreae]